MGLRDAFARYLRDQAERRTEIRQTEKDEPWLPIPEDAERDVHREGLLDAAKFVEQLSEDDPRLVALRAAGYYIEKSQAFSPGPRGQQVIRAWGIDRSSSVSPERFLEVLREAAERDEEQSER